MSALLNMAVKSAVDYGKKHLTEAAISKATDLVKKSLSKNETLSSAKKIIDENKTDESFFNKRNLAKGIGTVAVGVATGGSSLLVQLIAYGAIDQGIDKLFDKFESKSNLKLSKEQEVFFENVENETNDKRINKVNKIVPSY